MYDENISEGIDDEADDEIGGLRVLESILESEFRNVNVLGCGAGGFRCVSCMLPP